MPRSVPRLRPPLPLLPVAAVVAAYAALVVIEPRSSGSVTSYAATGAAARTIDLAAGIALLGAGVVLVRERHRRRIALLALAAGALWFGPDWEGWDGGPELVRSLGALAPPFFLAVVLHLALAFPNGLRSRRARALVAGGYALAVAMAATRALLRDPVLDLYCWRNCVANSFLAVSSVHLTHAVDTAWNAALLVLGFGLALAGGVVTVWRPPRAVRAVAALLGVVSAAYAATLLAQPLEDPRRPLFASFFYALAATATVLAATLSADGRRMLRARAALDLLVEELRAAPLPGQLERALASVLGDPGLRLGYFLPATRTFVDPNGEELGGSPGPGVARTPIVRGDETVAVVEHDAALLDVPNLANEIGAAVRLAVDNERLRAATLAQLNALRASRTRIVAAADTARRRLERALHDGAQQRLLALSYEIRLARLEAEQAGEDAVAARLATAEGDAVRALDDLRLLAHGIYPAVLEHGGLEAALGTLADTAPLPVEIEAVPATRFPPDVEATAYAVAAECVGDAAARGASFVRLTLSARESVLSVVAEDDGRRRFAPLDHITDRVGARGGAVELDPAGLRAEIPCV